MCEAHTQLAEHSSDHIQQRYHSDWTEALQVLYKRIVALVYTFLSSDIIGFLAYTHRRKLAVEVALNAINNETYITEPEEVTRIFAAIKPLLMDEEDQGE